MIAEGLIIFRETLEAALVVGIILAFLTKTEQLGYKKFVWWGVICGVLVSIITAFIFVVFFGGLSGKTEEIFEGTLMFVAAFLLTTMILWMAQEGKYVAQHLEEKTAQEIREGHALGILALVFFAIFREGVETVIFLGALSQIKPISLVGSVLGLLAAIILSWFIFLGVLKLRTGPFFRITSILLIFFAAGLLAHGIHEFQEAGVLPVFIEHLWDINWLIDEKSTLGEILKSLFGYNANPSLLEVVGWFVYLILIFGIYKNIENLHSLKLPKLNDKF